MRVTHERQQMVFTHAVKGNVPDQHQFVVLFLEHFLQVSPWFQVQATEDFSVHAGDASRCFAETVAIRVFADGQQHFPNGTLDPDLIDCAVFGWYSSTGKYGLEI